LPLGSTEASTEGEAGTTGPSPRTPTDESHPQPHHPQPGGGGVAVEAVAGAAAAAAAAASVPGGTVDKRRAVADIDTARHMEKQHPEGEQQSPWEEPSAVELAAAAADGGGNLSHVSSLSESVMHEVITETFREIKLDDPLAVTSPFAHGRQAAGPVPTSSAVVGGAAIVAPELEFDLASSRGTPRTDEEDEDDIEPKEEEDQQQQQQKRSGLRSVKTAATRGESPHDSVAATAGGGSPTPGKGDLFSFPVTSPSEHGGDRAGPGGFFASWPSFKNLSSPARSAGEGGYCSTEEEMTPQSKYGRRGHRPRLSTASSTGNFAGLPLPPAAPTHLALKFPQHVRRSSSQQGLATAVSTPISNGQYSDLALYEYNDSAFDEKYDVFDLKIIHRRGATGFEPTREIPLRINDLIGGRYQIVDLLGQAAFCRAVQALDLKTGALVCLKVVKNNKDYVDQSLDEIKVLRYVNNADPGDEQGILRLYDFFYFKEHLILVTELLRANLYEFTKYNRESGTALYFTMPRIQSIAWQVLRSIAFLHSLNLIHADLKPENILMKSYSACQVKVIDLGSSCFLTDRLSSYVQSRSYRAPEVILGLSYGQKIDLWSLGCILAELATGKVLFHNSTPPAILARVEGILGPIPQHMIARGRYSPRFFTSDGRIFEKNSQTGQVEFLRPKRTSLARRVQEADAGLLDFLSCLLQVDPARRPSAAEALQHPWLQQRY
jgi:dual specificity tyrosine-phosphorylation-regulated kinase 2/3/4